MADWACIDPAQAACGEGLLWDGDRACLWWVDIAQHSLHRHDPQTNRNETLKLPCLISALALRNDGALLIATENGLGRVERVDPVSGEIAILHNPEPATQGNRLNDMIAGPDGALWAGTMSEGAKGPTGALYCYGPDGVRAALSGTTISNGLAWSPDGSALYFIDSVPGILRVLRNGEWSILKCFDDATGKPDGMTVDAEGTLWIAICDRGHIIGMTPQGEITATLELPCTIVTNCAFGGDDMQRLYVTTGTFSMTEQEKAANPLAGGLFAIEMDVPGLAPYAAHWPLG